MDADKNYVSGDPDEQCGSTAYYKIHKDGIKSRDQEADCANGKDAWKVEAIPAYVGYHIY
jgi:hypothetical protein